MNKIKDASSFFLWEDSGDSEVDRLSSHPYELESITVGDDQEDAQSCSCEGYASELRSHDFHDDGDHDLVVGRMIGDSRSDQLDERRRSGAGLEQYISDHEEEEEEEEESSNNVGVIQNMNEMEDKVFWDTCMAGGYP